MEKRLVWLDFLKGREHEQDEGGDDLLFDDSDDDRSNQQEEVPRRADPKDSKDAHDKIERWILQAEYENRERLNEYRFVRRQQQRKGVKYRRLTKFCGSRKLHPIHLQQLSEAAQGLSEVRSVSSFLILSW